MAPTHHPSAQALANLLIADCSPGAALLVTQHLALCARCASRVQAMGSVGVSTGEIIYDEPETLEPGLEVTLVLGASGLGEAVFYVRAAPGRTLPLDEPLPAVELLVLEGGLEADGVQYLVGDFLSVEETPKQCLVSHPASGCVYLMTAQDPGGLLGAD
jgi:anti-sigma factor ChrR (cupin superfamily)